VKLGEAYGWTGIRIEGPQELEAGIRQMLETDGPVIVDCRVAKLSNCFPMIPSGAAHTEMLLDPNQIEGVMSDEAKALV
jgi:acetolactate synthase-1/2/3 large subunit